MLSCVKLIYVRWVIIILMKTLIDVSHVSKKSKSLRITIPKKVIDELRIQPSEILGYYLEDGKIVLEKIK